jgi:sialidase-1
VADGGQTLLAFAEARVWSCSDGGPKAVAYRRSTDGGATWGAISWLYRDPSESPLYDGLNLGTAVHDAATGAVHLFVVNGSHTLPLAPAGLLRSPDTGATWASDVDWSLASALASDGINMFAGGPGTGVALPSGRLVVSGWYNWCCGQQAAGSDDTGCALVVSDDAGLTWQAGAKLPKDFEGSGLWPNECDVALDPATSNLVVSVREASGGGFRVVAFSEDEGETFAGPHQSFELPDPTCQGAIVGDPNHTGLLFSSHAFNQHSRVNGTLSASADGGASWTPVAVIDPLGFSYSALGVLNATHVAVLFEADAFGIVFAAMSKTKT